jgi:hypothetical protein
VAIKSRTMRPIAIGPWPIYSDVEPSQLRTFFRLKAKRISGIDTPADTETTHRTTVRGKQRKLVTM